MQYMKLNAAQREELMASLAGMSEYLRDAFHALSPEEAGLAGPSGAFSPVEQVWHLADLERDGFGVRIRRLQAELHPCLPDFDGTRVAQERSGTQEGVGEVSLCDMPAFLLQHDQAHVAEIQAWKRFAGR